MTEVGTYVYAITRGTGRPHPADLTGVAGTQVRTVERAGLVAYVSTVPLEEFGEEPLRRSLEDLDWIGCTARAHHQVVEAVAETVPTAPVRLVTVYTSEEQVSDLLDRRHDDFVAVLSRVTGRREWGVKAYAEQDTAPSSTAGESGEAPENAEADSPGTAYLKRRQASLRSREDAQRRALAQAEHVHAALAAVAVASLRHRPQDPELSGRTEWMVLNGAYLVDDDRGDEFAATLDVLRGQGLDLELTGPWAPYSFTAIDLDTAGPETPDGT
ncbi:GvpL/GvpF family gas vesicle protein [Streptosporangium sp. NPDC087985]|uniref:GvpL/GvpF family gas vesicle protein n=1 Tax=Streptosporangium sp. NPDC087985 TaxID=3366196 RepID=UPI00380261E3